MIELDKVLEEIDEKINSYINFSHKSFGEAAADSKVVRVLKDLKNDLILKYGRN